VEIEYILSIYPPGSYPHVDKATQLSREVSGANPKGLSDGEAIGNGSYLISAFRQAL